MNDIEDVHRLLDVELREPDVDAAGTEALAERERWLRWTVLNYDELASLKQPPYGDRAVVHQRTGELIGLCGLVPSLAPFGQLAHPGEAAPPPALYTNEMGLYYAFAPAHRRQGYATEASAALVEFAFEQLRLKRIVATTTHDNTPSVRVMEKLGMRIARNPHAEPPWFQVAGILDNLVAATSEK